MTRMVQCLYLKKQAEGLTAPPLPGPLGQKIFDHVSKDAWNAWIKHQTLLINENQLNMMDPNAKTFLRAEMEKFLFGDGSEKPAGFKPND